MKTLKFIRILTWSLIGLITIGLGSLLLAPQKDAGSGVASVGGPFRLISHDGVMIDSTALKGKPFALFFGFTHCPDICPTSMLEISNDLNALGQSAKGFQVYFVTVDPERDTAPILKDYTASFDARIIGLIPQNEDELSAITKSYRAMYRRVPTPSSYTMDHTASIYLMDANGAFFGTLDSQDKPENRQAKLKRLFAKV